MRPLTLLLGLALVPALARAQFKIIVPVDGRLGGVNSGAEDRKDSDLLKSSGGELDLHVAPILGWTQSRWLILPAADLSFNSTNTILKVDDERFEFLQQLTSRGELGTAFRMTPDVRFGARLFVEGFQAKQAANEELLVGQYNYQDSGASLDWRQKWSLMRTTLGATVTDRRYPHWKSLDGSERSEKDQAIAKGYVDLEWPWEAAGGVTRLGLSYQNAGYYSGVVIDEAGLTTTTRLQDGVFNANLEIPMRFGNHDVSANLGLTNWSSNFNYFDSQNFVYIPLFNDFTEVNGGIGYAYAFGHRWWFLKSPQLSLDVDLELRQYVKRLARAADGSYKPDKERDFVRNVTLGFNSALSESWGLYMKFNQLVSASNNEDSGSSLTNYRFNTFALGVNFAY